MPDAANPSPTAAAAGRAAVVLPPLDADEVRVYTLATGDRDITRRAVRTLLAALLGVAVDTVRLDYGPKGKPTLANDPALHFSVSHAEDAAMVAVTRVAAVGVDIERVRAVPRAEVILRRFFPAEDADAILGAADRDLRFTRAWTRAEATVKVRGASLWEAATPDPSVTTRDLVAPSGYVASVAVAAATWRVVPAVLPAGV